MQASRDWWNTGGHSRQIAPAQLAKYWNVEGEWEANLCAIEADMASIGAVFGGSFKAPDLLVDDDESPPNFTLRPMMSWRVDLKKGEATHGETDVTYWCALPIEKTDACSPGNQRECHSVNHFQRFFMDTVTVVRASCGRAHGPNDCDGLCDVCDRRIRTWSKCLRG